MPSGASTGTFEAHERRDGGTRYAGKGCLEAVASVRSALAPAVQGMDACEQEAVDAVLCQTDGTPDLSALGANAILSVSVATLLAAADAHREEPYAWLNGGAPPLVPLPMVNVISGGAHASGIIDIQDFLVVPLGASCFTEAIEWASRVRQATADLAEDAGMAAGLVADEGGLGLPLATNREALTLLMRGIEGAGLAPGADVGIAIDVAANQFWRDGSYVLRADAAVLDSEALVSQVVSWCEEFPIVSVEDVVADQDRTGWAMASRALGHRVQLLGDDLFVTDLGRLTDGAREGIANAILVKPNQTGTLSRAKTVLEAAKGLGYRTVVSARSGETEDSWLADLAVGWEAGQIKVGSVMRSERTAKWNRLLRLEAELAGTARYGGGGAITAPSSAGPASAW
jgi:enolase